uniref:Uncharacterized protein n=1 Tax=Spongospora subterranea TaxID=70186 RepID=A0A0H5QFC8_9EUKA|eukprot:CRZ00746.1 hypothetical protein [Spongospora subterranea]
MNLTCPDGIAIFATFAGGIYILSIFSLKLNASSSTNNWFRWKTDTVQYLADRDIILSDHTVRLPKQCPRLLDSTNQMIAMARINSISRIQLPSNSRFWSPLKILLAVNWGLFSPNSLKCSKL